MAMSRVDFERMALALGETIAYLEPTREVARSMVQTFGTVCYAANGRFDRNRFERVTMAHATRLGYVTS
jgi:hypothetical protein